MISQKKFKINRSNILKDILRDKGWKEASEYDNIDFSYYDTWDNSWMPTNIFKKLN